jgi:DNA repair protein RecO (recombination protein O)
MLHATRGIVLKTIKYSESSVITKIYTEKFGLRSYIIKGVSGKSKSNKKALLQGLSLLNLVVYEKPGSNLQNIREMEHARHFGSIPLDIRKSTISMFLNEVLFKSMVEETGNPELFGFVFDKLVELDQSEKFIADFHIRFLLDLSKFMGFYPNHNHSENNKYFDLQEGFFVSTEPLHNNYLDVETSKNFGMMLSREPSGYHFTSAERNDLLEKLILYYGLHLPTFGELKSYAVLKQVLND